VCSNSTEKIFLHPRAACPLPPICPLNYNFSAEQFVEFLEAPSVACPTRFFFGFSGGLFLWNRDTYN
jgi:hypothetical protein